MIEIGISFFVLIAGEYMNVTAESSMPHVQAIGYLPPETQCWLYTRDDERVQALAELAQAKAQLARQRKAQAANGKHAGSTRTARIHEAITAMANQHAPQLRVWSGSQASRALFVRNQIKWAIKKDGSWHTLTKPPNVRTIDRIIKGLQL